MHLSQALGTVVEEVAATTSCTDKVDSSLVWIIVGSAAGSSARFSERLSLVPCCISTPVWASISTDADSRKPAFLPACRRAGVPVCSLRTYLPSFLSSSFLLYKATSRPTERPSTAFYPNFPSEISTGSRSHSDIRRSFNTGSAAGVTGLE